MKQDIAEKWIAALESGEYKQGKGTLESANNTFCCLGVLCAIAPEDVVNREVVTTECGADSYCDDLHCYVTYDDQTGVLPDSIQEWSGLKDSTGALPEGTSGAGDVSLIYYNDVVGYSFHQIAQLIRENIDAL